MSDESVCSGCYRPTGFGYDDKGEPPVNLARCPSPGGLECRAVAQAVAPLLRENEILHSNIDDVLLYLDEHSARASSAERTVEIQKELLLSAQRVERDLRQQLAHVSTLADERLAHANQLQADIEAEMQGRLALRKLHGAREDETMGKFLERLGAVYEGGWQWRPTDTDTAFAPPFGTIRKCRVCGCLVVGGPTVCTRCAEPGPDGRGTP